MGENKSVNHSSAAKFKRILLPESFNHFLQSIHSFRFFDIFVRGTWQNT